MRLKDAERFPYNMTLGGIDNDTLLYDYGREVARQCRLLGVQAVFAPVLDVNSRPDNPVIGRRSFGENPERKPPRLGLLARARSGRSALRSQAFPGPRRHRHRQPQGAPRRRPLCRNSARCRPAPVCRLRSQRIRRSDGRPSECPRARQQRYGLVYVAAHYGGTAPQSPRL